MSTLHTVNKSPFTHNTLTSCLRIARAGDSILLLEDGVYAATGEHQLAHQLQQAVDAGIHVYVLLPHLQERQLALPATIEAVDYPGFVDLSTRHQRIQSWHT